MRIVALEIEHEESTYQHKPFKQGIVKGNIGYKWIDFEVQDWSADIHTLEIVASTDAPGGTIGYWISSLDCISHGALNAPSFVYSQDGLSDEFFIDQHTWEFSDNPKLKVYRPDAKSSNPIFKFSVLVRPYLPTLKPFSLRILGASVNDRISANEIVFDRTFVFEKGERQQVGDEMTPPEQVKIMNYEFERFKEQSADNLKGPGNIVHPKQFFTIRGVEYVLKNYLDSSKKINLAYIGTDTTENLRSIVRWLLFTGKANRIESLTVFYTTQWDRNFLKRIDLENEYAQHCPELRINFLELSEEIIHLQEQRDNFDVIIATYVAPWAVGQSRKSYKKLLNATMGFSSYLVSIDPQDETSSVRSELTSYTNSHELYDILQMSTARPPVDYENNSVEWSVWKKNRTAGSGV